MKNINTFIISLLRKIRYWGRYNPKTNDIFLSLGAAWQHACYLDAISDIKKSLHSLIFLIHDFIPYLFPHFYEDPKFGEYYFRFICEITALANKVLCNSKNTHNDLIRLVHDESIKTKTSVIELGSDFCEKKQISKKYLKEFEIPGDFNFVCRHNRIPKESKLFTERV